MKVAITYENGNVCPHFGRAPAFLLAEIEKGSIKSTEIIENPGFRNHAPGVVPRFVKEKGVDVLITGGMGPMAHKMFEEFGITVIMGVTGSVDDALKAFTEGTLKGGESTCSHDR